ncbi:MAG: hypothetical protein HY238_22425 [Acidobacteria bacterium]|nr:hypothetical protein [Acidobacteriota bacterium]
MTRVSRLAAISIVLSNGIASGQAILAPGGRTLFNKNLLVRSFTRIERQSISRDGSVSSRTTYIQPLALVYGIAPDWNVTAVAPFVVAESSGWADTQFFVKYDSLVKRNAPGGTTRLSAEFGVQAPTGSDRFSSGAFAFLGDLVFHTARNRKFFLADIQYRAATRNGQGVTTGNSFGFDLAPAYLWLPGENRAWSRLFRHGVIGILELNGELQNRARTRTSAIGDTGGFTLLLSPGLQYFPRPNLVIELSVPIPVVRELNGVRPKPLAGVLVGFRYVL